MPGRVLSVLSVSFVLALSPLSNLAVSAGESEPDAQQAPPRRAPLDLETGVFELRHLETQTAISLLRSMIQSRHVAELSSRRMVVLRDDPEAVAAAEQLLAEVDVPAVRWQAELVLDGGDGATVVRSAQLEHDPLKLNYGRSGGGLVRVAVQPKPSGSTELLVEYQLSVVLPGDGRNFDFSAEGTTLLPEGGRLVLLEPALKGFRESLAQVLGLDGEGRELFLRFSRIREDSRGTVRASVPPRRR